MPNIRIQTIMLWPLQKGNHWRAILSAFLMYLANPGGVSLWMIAWFGLLPFLLQLFEQKSLKWALGVGLIFGVVYHLLITQWLLGLHPLEWMGFSTLVSLGISILIWVANAIYQGALIAIFSGLIYGLHQRLVHQNRLLELTLYSVLWVLVFYGLNCLLIPNPVGLMAYSQSSCEWMLQASSIITFLGLESLIIFCNLLVCFAIKENNPKYFGHAIFSFLFPVIICWVMGPVKNNYFENNTVWISQINLGIETIRSPEFTVEKERDAYLAVINKKLAATKELPNDLILVLPEGVLPTAETAEQIKPQMHLISGAFDHLINDAQELKTFNAVVAYDKNKNSISIFHKRILVPFGETTPIVGDEIMTALVKMYGGKYQAGLTPAQGPQKLLKLNQKQYVAYVCFDVVFPHLVIADKLQAPDAIITVSNLGWFHQHPQLAKQYLAFNQFRAAELKRPLILSANTGPSSFIEASGEIRCKLDQDNVGVLDSANCKTD